MCTCSVYLYAADATIKAVKCEQEDLRESTYQLELVRSDDHIITAGKLAPASRRATRK